MRARVYIEIFVVGFVDRQQVILFENDPSDLGLSSHSAAKVDGPLIMWAIKAFPMPSNDKSDAEHQGAQYKARWTDPLF